MTADVETAVKVAVYQYFAAAARAPTPAETATIVGVTVPAVIDAYRSLRSQRVLFLEPDGETIRMAPPFSAVPTEHTVLVGGREYSANCAWDALGIVAALGEDGVVRSRCAESGAPLILQVGPGGPAPSDWVFHSLVPAAHWWDDLVFT